MESKQIKPDKITKPIQLLAVWMTGLIILVSGFLTAAGTIKEPDWLPAFFAICAVSIIPVFLLLVFLLQTKFRPEMQEDTFYSEYLDSITRQKKIIENNNENNSAEGEYEKVLTIMNTKISQLSEQTRLNLERIKEQITKAEFGLKEIQETENIIKQTDESIDKVELSFISARVNINLNNFQEIIKTLVSRGLMIGQNFGEGNEVPPFNLLTIGSNINPKTVGYLLPTLIDLGMTKINRTEMKGYENKIVLGSYSYKHGKLINITDHLMEKINEVDDFEEFKKIIPKG